MAEHISQGRSKINQRLLDVPVGAVLTLAWLRSRGISSKLANYYATSGWLHRVGDGAFTVRPDSPDWLGAVFGLQQKAPSLHPGGRTALELAGLAHFLPLGDQAPVYLFGRSGERLPEWFKRLAWAGRIQHVHTNFLPPELGLGELQAGGFSVRVSDPERAILEFLLHLTTDEAGYKHASLVFEGLGTLRASLLQALLEECTSVKVKRLFLHLAEKHHHTWLGQLNMAKISLGSGKRVLVPGGRLDPKYLITVGPAAVSDSTTPLWAVSNVTGDTTFPVSRIDSLRTKPGRKTDFLDGLPDGWSISPVDPTTVLVPFKSLRLRPGLVLRAYQLKEGGNGNAVVWAVPVDAEFPDPGLCPRLPGVYIAPPKPPGGLDDVMEAIEGDETPWSYLCASLLARELGEFGAMWHGSEWGTHDILGAEPWTTTKRHQSRSPEEAWQWSEPVPAVWKPRAHVAGDVATVTFFTYTALGQERIIRHTDTFKVGSYQFATQEKVLATGPAGYVW